MSAFKLTKIAKGSEELRKFIRAEVLDKLQRSNQRHTVLELTGGPAVLGSNPDHRSGLNRHRISSWIIERERPEGDSWSKDSLWTSYEITAEGSSLSPRLIHAPGVPLSLADSRPDIFVLQDLGELLELGVDGAVLSTVLNANRLGYGAVLGYAEDSKRSSDESRSWANRLIEVFLSGDQEKISDTIEGYADRWNLNIGSGE